MVTTKGRIEAIAVSSEKGISKLPVDSVEVIKMSGIEGDAHAGSGLRQISMLSIDSHIKVRKSGVDVEYGGFAENLVVKGIDTSSLKPGMRMMMGEGVVVEVTQVGKECDSRCRIFEQAGCCAMSDEGIFLKVLSGGILRPGDTIDVLP